MTKRYPFEPIRPSIPPSNEEWLDILREGGIDLLNNPYDHESRMGLARSLFMRGYEYEARICMSGKLVPILGRRYFPSKIPPFSIFDADASERGIRVTPVAPVNNAPDWIPASVGIDPLPFMLRARKRWERNHFVAELDHGRLVTNPWGYAIFDRDGNYSTDFCCNDGPMIPFSGVLPPITTIPGTVAVFSHYCSFAVFHWMLETLPRFELLRLAGELEKIDFFAMRYMLPWHWEFIDLLGIPREKFLSLGDTCHIEADRLLVCSNVEDADFSIYPGHHEPEPWITDLIARLAPPSPPVEKTERIYISRENARSRQVSNHPELRSLLERYGFRTVFFEDMSFAEKAALLKTADVVVSPTGAALTHIPLMQPGSKCIILYCEDSVYAAKHIMCANTGVIHVHSISPALSRFQPEAMRQMPEHMREITVDITRLQELLEFCDITPR